MTGPPPCVLFALRRESRPFLRRFHRRPLRTGAPCPAWLCEGPAGRVLVCETGPGAAATEAALRWLLSEPAPPFVITAGFCGGLRPDLRVSEVVLATEVYDIRRNQWPASLTAAGGVDLDVPFRRGPVLTAGLITAPFEKRELAASLGFLAVDMESATAARLCHERNIPFACLRAVSDAAETPLSPELIGLLNGGRVSAGRVLAALARRPALAGELWRLARDTRTAARQLAAGLVTLLNRASGPAP